MPEEFKPRISKVVFWQYICTFLSCVMKFEMYEPGYGKMDQVWDNTYENMGFKSYYLVYETSYEDTQFYKQYACDNATKSTKVVFRIYKKS